MRGLLLFFGLLVAAVALAKRAPPRDVPPIVHGGIEYRFPHFGYLKGWRSPTSAARRTSWTSPPGRCASAEIRRYARVRVISAISGEVPTRSGGPQ